MASTSIMSVCIAAFVLIFFLLSLLSAMMRLLTYVFPPIETDDKTVSEVQQIVNAMRAQGTRVLCTRADSATFAAITTAYDSIYPDRKITGIKETTK